VGLKRLNLAPGLYDLIVNPLLLTMIANVHHYRGGDDAPPGVRPAARRGPRGVHGRAAPHTRATG
jgi:hypothetical protein